MITIKNLCIAILLLFALGLTSFAQKNINNPILEQTEFNAKIDSIVEKYANLLDIPRIAVGVVQNGKSIHVAGYGTANLDTKVPVTSRTLFKTSSVSKIFTAIAVMQLVERGFIKLEDKLIEHVKYFKTDDENYKMVTVRHLLTHTSGVPRVYKRNYGFENPEYDDDAIKRYVISLENKKFNFLPGEQQEYSNVGFVLLSALVEEVKGIRFEDYISEYILKPAEMTESTSDYQNIDKSKLAAGHVIGNNFNNSVNSFFPDTRWITGADGLYSTVEDMNKLAITLMDDYKNDSRKILRKETLEKMWTKDDDGLTLCWEIMDVWGGKLIGHRGNSPGFSTAFIFFDDIAITVFCNSNRSANMGITSSIIKTIKNIEHAPPRLSGFDQIRSIMQKNGFDAGIEELKKLKKKEGENFNTFGPLAFSLEVMQGNAEKRLLYAKEILETVVEDYPEDVNVNDFIAEVYFRLALKHYGKTNNLDPNNWGLNKMYDQLSQVDLNFYK